MDALKKEANAEMLLKKSSKSSANNEILPNIGQISLLIYDQYVLLELAIN